MSLLATAVALLALAVSAPGASAAGFSGGTSKLDFKALLSATGAKASFTGADSKTKTAGVFDLGAGTLTMVAQSSGNLNYASGKAVVLTRTIKVRGKSKTYKVTLGSLVQKVAAGKASLGAKINNKGKVVYLFSEASANKIKANSTFTELAMSSSKMTVTKAGATALNKALALAHDTALANKDAAGTATFKADRQLTITGGTNALVYDQAFYDKLKSNDEGCSIILSHVAPATAIPEGGNAPRGGVNLPFQAGDKISAKTFGPLILHTGGVTLDRGPGNPQGSEYHTQLTQISIAPETLIINAFSSLTNSRIDIGNLINPSFTPNLTDTGGSITISGTQGLSTAAAGALQALSDPDGAGPKGGCAIPAGSNVGAMTGNVEVN